MPEQQQQNKQGQSLGKKGQATRARLMKAAETLLKQNSPLDLTAVAIAKAADTSSATFYMYFDDVKDVYYSLSILAGNDVVEAMESVGESVLGMDAEPAATKLVDAIHGVWNKHRHILAFRNLEADRGEEQFDKLRMSSYMKEVGVLRKWVRYGGNDKNARPSKGDAFALASVLHAALERLASLDPQLVDNGLGQARFRASQARVIAQIMVDTPRWGKLPIAVK